jgi:hypothetical protein
VLSWCWRIIGSFELLAIYILIIFSVFDSIAQLLIDLGILPAPEANKGELLPAFID